MFGDLIIVFASIIMGLSKSLVGDYKEVIIWVVVGLWSTANYIDRRLDDR